MTTYYQIKWISTAPIKNDADYEEYNHTYELCMEFNKKNKSKQDLVIAKYNPNYIIKYPININKKDSISNGKIIINSSDFKYTITKNDLMDVYITQTKYNKNGSYTVQKIKINSQCLQNECNLVNQLIHSKKLYLKLNTTCDNNETNCHFATISTKHNILL